MTMSASAPLDAVSPVRRRPTLLVVDDEEGPRHSLRVIFKDDYEILMAGDGPTAIELAQKNPIDVAVVGTRTGGMSGNEGFARLGNADARLAVGVVTSLDTSETIRPPPPFGACDYIN